MMMMMTMTMMVRMSPAPPGMHVRGARSGPKSTGCAIVVQTIATQDPFQSRRKTAMWSAIVVIEKNATLNKNCSIT